ncbi:MAG: hypothetical protein KDA59_01830 [Planctomycetales bacterium]|nr:hypothetical protein [Planctomycetales bacterium]
MFSDCVLAQSFADEKDAPIVCVTRMYFAKSAVAAKKVEQIGFRCIEFDKGAWLQISASGDVVVNELAKQH